MPEPSKRTDQRLDRPRRSIISLGHCLTFDSERLARLNASTHAAFTLNIGEHHFCRPLFRRL